MTCWNIHNIQGLQVGRGALFQPFWPPAIMVTLPFGGARGRMKLPLRGGPIYGRALLRAIRQPRRKSRMTKKAANRALYRQKNRLKG